ncbi:MAG: cyclase family protein, partial [Anaerolineales bacterium]|nr:cyclase family protein [Anaerolineales bacterium]
MRVYDVTLTISEDLPVWPGDPKIKLERENVKENGGEMNQTRLEMSAHTGTHVDAPYHFLPQGSTVDQIPLSTLTGRAYVQHLPDVDRITAEVLEEVAIPPRTRRVLFKTRNSDLWTAGEKNFQKDYVAVSPDAAEYLVDRGVRLVGVDYLSVAPFDLPRPTHEIFLDAGVVIVEGL